MNAWKAHYQCNELKPKLELKPELELESELEPEHEHEPELELNLEPPLFGYIFLMTFL